MAKRAGESDRSARTSPATAEKRAQALELRKAGASYDQIARMVGYASPGSAHNQVQLALRSIVAEPAKDVLDLELERLNTLLMHHWKSATVHGDQKAAALVLKLMDRRAKYLGLDVQNGPGDTSEVAAWLVAMGLPMPNASSQASASDEPDLEDLI